MIKNLPSALLLSASIYLSGLILHDAITGLMLSETQIQESFYGAAREDVLGFGFGPSLALITIVHIVLIGLSQAIEYKVKWLLVTASAAAFSLLVWAIDIRRTESIALEAGLI